MSIFNKKDRSLNSLPSPFEVGFWLDVVMSFLWTDLAFVALPVLILVFFEIAIAKFELSTILASADYSFALVTLLAVALSQFIDLKVRIQKDSSEKIYIGTKVIVILLVLACICMVLALIKQKTKILDVPDSLLVRLNATLTLAGTFLIFLKIAWEKALVRRYKLGTFPTEALAFEFSLRKLNAAAKRVETVKNLLIVQRLSSKKDTEAQNDSDRDAAVVKKKRLAEGLAHIQEDLKVIERYLKEVKNSK